MNRIFWIALESEQGIPEERESQGFVAALRERGWKIEFCLLTNSRKPPLARDLTQRWGVDDAHLIRGPEFRKHLEFLASRTGGEAYFVCDGFLAAKDAGLKNHWIYLARQCESKLWQSASRELRQPWDRLRARWEAFRVSREERALLESASLVVARTLVDFRALKRLAPHFRGGIAHEGITIPRIIPPFPEGANAPLRMVFTGHLDWPPNQEGVEWFLTRVWPALLKVRPQVELRIAGPGSPDWLLKKLPLKGVSYWGESEDPNILFEETHLAIAPVFLGSGTRSATLEAASLGRATLSTALGIEGLGLERGLHYFHAEHEADWLETLAHLDPLLCRSIGFSAREHVRAEYGWAKAIKEFEGLFSAKTSGVAAAPVPPSRSPVVNVSEQQL